MGMAILVTNLANYEPLWVDEGWSMIVTGQESPVAVTQMVAKDVHPPLYFYLLYLWRIIAGDSVFAARFLTVLMTLISAALIYRLGADFFGRFTGGLSATLYILHDLVIVLGREVRQYPLLQLLTILTVWTYWQFRQNPTRRRGLWIVLSGSALLWTNYWGGFVLLALALDTLITQRRRIMPYIFVYGLIALSFVPWLPVLYAQMTQNVPDGIGHALPATQGGYEVLAFQLLGRPEWVWGLLMVAGIMFTRRWRPDQKTLLLGGVVIVPVALTILINLNYATLSFRTLSLVIPLVLILVAHVIGNLHYYGRIVLAAILLVLSVVLTDAQPPVRLPWDEIADYAHQHSNYDDAVLIETWFDTYALQYYLEQEGNIAYLPTEITARERDEAGFVAYLDDALTDYDGLWAVRFSPFADITPRLVERGYQLTGRLEWQTEVAPVELLRFDRPVQADSIANFDDVLALRDGTLISTAESGLGVNLLWEALTQPSQDYFVSVFALTPDGVLVAQDDAPPFNTATRTWTAGNLYFDPHDLPPLAPGTYDIGVRVYWFTDATFENIANLPPLNCGADCEFIVLEQVTIHE